MKYLNGRINRRDFIIGMFLFNLTYSLVYGITLLFFFHDHPLREFQLMDHISATLAIGSYYSVYTLPGLFFNVGGLVIILLSLGICIRRFHDIGRSGWLVILIPLAYILRMTLAHVVHFFLENSIRPSTSDLLLFKISDYFSIVILLIFAYLTLQSGESAKNKYGEVPKNSSIKKILLN